MAIKASGNSLSFSEIEAQFDNSQPYSLSEFYAGGSSVFSGCQDEAGNAIPSSSTIKVSDFYSTHTVTTGARTTSRNISSYTIPHGVSTLDIILHGGGGTGGEGDESGAGGGGGGGGSGGVVVGTLTVSNNIQGNPTQQTISISIGGGGVSIAGGGSAEKQNGGNTSITYGGQTTIAGYGGYGGGFSGNGSSYNAASPGSNSIGSNFSASVNTVGTTGDGSQGGSNADNFSSAGTAGKVTPVQTVLTDLSNAYAFGSEGGIAGAINPDSNSVQTGKSASGICAGGGGAASRDRSNTGHWFGGSGSGGYVRIVVAS